MRYLSVVTIGRQSKFIRVMPILMKEMKNISTYILTKNETDSVILCHKMMPRQMKRYKKIICSI